LWAIVVDSFSRGNNMSSAAEASKTDPNGKDKECEIVVNGTAHVVPDDDVTYEQLVALAFPGASDPNVTYSVAYRKAHGNGGSGTLVADGSVKAKKGTSFNVTPTTRS